MGFHGIYGTYKCLNDGLIHYPHKDFLIRMRRQVLTCARNFGDDLGLSRNLDPPKSH